MNQQHTKRCSVFVEGYSGTLLGLTLSQALDPGGRIGGGGSASQSGSRPVSPRVADSALVAIQQQQQPEPVAMRQSLAMCPEHPED